MNEGFEFETLDEQPSLLETEEEEFRRSVPVVRDHRSGYQPAPAVRWQPPARTGTTWSPATTPRPWTRPAYTTPPLVRPAYTTRPLFRPAYRTWPVARPGYAPWSYTRPGYTARPPYYWRQPSQWQGGYGNAPWYGQSGWQNPFSPGQGTREEQIRWVQQFLNRILNQNLPVDGVMSPVTRHAIRHFQRRFGLPPTGFVGPDTQQALVSATTAPDGDMQDPSGDMTGPAAIPGVDASGAPGGIVVGAPQIPPGANADAHELLQEYGLPLGEFELESEFENWESGLDPGYASFPYSSQGEFEESFENAFELEAEGNGGVSLQPNLSGRAGFGNAPQSFGLRVRIIGYATPLWKGARSAAEADRLNFELSAKRAQAVHAIVEKELRAKLGDHVKIDYAVSQLEPRSPQGVEIGSYGVGSSDALNAAHGDRTDNSEMHRKVEVMIEKITTTYTAGGVSLPPQRVPGRTNSWTLRVTKLRMLAVGPALGSIEIILRNRLTNKQMFATANLYGGGLGYSAVKAGSNLQKQIVEAAKNNLRQVVADFIGRGEVPFTTEREMGFEDFDDQFIRAGKLLFSFGLKGVYSYVTFTPFIKHRPERLTIQSKLSLGWPDSEGWVVSGKLHLRGPNPGNWTEYDRTGWVHSSYDKSWQETLMLTFKTGRWDIGPTDATRLTEFVDTWARRFI